MWRDVILLEMTFGFALAAAWALAAKGLPLFEPARPRWIVVGCVFILLGIASLIELVGIPEKPRLSSQSERTGA